MSLWCADRGMDVGAVLDVPTMWRLARDWYADRLDRDWRPRSAADASRRFEAAGLSGPFWALG